MFVRTKHKIDKRHEFALVVINDDALWVSTAVVHSTHAVCLQHLYYVYCPFPSLMYVRMCFSYQASPLTPGSCAAACTT